jgi:hypothetical protein
VTFAIAGAVLGVAHALIHIQTDPLADVPTYYLGGQRLNDGQPLYQDTDPDVNPYYRYPPLLAIAMRPFSLLPYPVFAALWEAGTILVFILFVLRLGVRRRTTWIALGLLGDQIGDAIPIGQAQTHVTWLLALGQPWSVALAGQIKLFPVLAALYWVGRGEWRKLSTFLIWTAALVLLQFVLAPGAVLDYVNSVSLDQVGQSNQLSPYVVSPALWFALVLAFLVITPVVARTRFGWPTAVAFASLAYPRLFGYHLMTLAAALRPPDAEGSLRTTGRRAGSIDGAQRLRG